MMLSIALSDCDGKVLIFSSQGKDTCPPPRDSNSLEVGANDQVHTPPSDTGRDVIVAWIKGLNESEK